MKKIIFILLGLSLLAGCSNENKKVEKIKESSVSNSIYNYELNYGSLSNPYRGIFSTSIFVKDTFYMWNNTLGGKTILSTYNFNDNKNAYLNDDPSKVCSSENKENCSGYFKEPIKELTYYNEKLYYSLWAYDSSTNEQTYEIYQMDIDATNRKKIFSTIPKLEKIPGYYFHKGYLYYTGDSQLLKFDIGNWEYKVVFEQKDISITNMSFDGDTGFLMVENYVEGGEVYPKVMLEVDLLTEKVKLAYAFDDDILFISKKYIIEYKNKQLISLNRETNKEVIFTDLSSYVFQHDNYLILSQEIYEETEDNKITYYILADLDGNIYDKIEKGENRGVGEYFDGEYFYTTQVERDQNEGYITKKSMVRYRIIDNRFQEVEKVFEIMGD